MGGRRLWFEEGEGLGGDGGWLKRGCRWVEAGRWAGWEEGKGGRISALIVNEKKKKEKAKANGARGRKSLQHKRERDLHIPTEVEHNYYRCLAAAIFLVQSLAPHQIDILDN